MKDLRDPNFVIDLSAAEGAIDPRIGEFLPRSYSIRLNNAVEIVILPFLESYPWPPAFPDAFDAFNTREEAARYVLATTPVVVVPYDASATRIDTVAFPHSEMTHNVIWIPEQEYRSLLDEVETILARPIEDENARLRLDDLAAGPLRRLLVKDLPDASLTNHQRDVLCLK